MESLKEMLGEKIPKKEKDVEIECFNCHEKGHKAPVVLIPRRSGKVPAKLLFLKLK